MSAVAYGNKRLCGQDAVIDELLIPMSGFVRNDIFTSP